MDVELQASIRSKDEKLDKDCLAAIVYGPGSENTMIKLKINDFVKVYEKAGESNLIELDVDGAGKIQVLIKEYQKSPLKGFFTHVDFYKVDMSKEVSAEIPLSFIGESKAVKELGALFIKNIDSLEVECLPKDLVDHIDVDISGLLEFGDVIQVKDIRVSASLKILNNLDDAVVSVVEPREDRVETKIETAPDSEKKKEDEIKKD